MLPEVASHGERSVPPGTGMTFKSPKVQEPLKPADAAEPHLGLLNHQQSSLAKKVF